MVENGHKAKVPADGHGHRFQVAVLQVDDSTAVKANQVMMGPVRDDFELDAASTQVSLADHTQVAQSPERAIDGRQVYVAAVHTNLLMDPLGAGVTV
jgi:hypothetical protein